MTFVSIKYQNGEENVEKLVNAQCQCVILEDYLRQHFFPKIDEEGNALSAPVNVELATPQGVCVGLSIQENEQGHEYLSTLIQFVPKETAFYYLVRGDDVPPEGDENGELVRKWELVVKAPEEGEPALPAVTAPVPGGIPDPTAGKKK